MRAAHSSVTPAPASATPGANIALGIFLLAYIMSFVDRQILSLLVDPIRQDLGISNVQMGLLQGFAFAALYGVAGVPLGLLADRYSRKRLISAGVLFWSAATAACGLSSSFVTLFAARTCVGLGEATLSPAAHSFLSDAFPPERLARAMAIYTLGITIGGGSALMIGGMVVDAVSRSGDVVLPVVGALRGWQLSFLIVAAPGVLLAGLIALIREPARRSDAQSARIAGGLSALLRHIAAHRRAFFGIYVSSTALGIMGYGLSGWYPSLLIRSYGFSAGEAGRSLGAIFLILGSAGALTGGLLAERLARRGRDDANLRVVAGIALTVTLFAVVAPLMPTATGVLLVFAPVCFLFNGYFGCSIAAMQLATPRGMRATNAALFLLANSLVGLSIGTSIIPLLDSWLFGDTGHVGPALALTAAIAAPVACGAATWGLRAYGSLVQQMNNAQPAG